MKANKSVCKNCGHPVGKLPRGLYVLRDDFEHNIRIYSTGREWMHIVEYTDDRKIIGTMDLDGIRDEVNGLVAEVHALGHDVPDEDASELMSRLQYLKLELGLMKDVVEGNNRDSRMFVEKCWGNHMHCTCTNPEPEVGL